MDQRRRVQRLPGRLPGHAGGRHPPQLGVHEREQVGRRPPVPAGGRVQESGHVVHTDESTPPPGPSRTDSPTHPESPANRVNVGDGLSSRFARTFRRSLSVFDDNTITVGPSAAGAILVYGGAVRVIGVAPTVANATSVSAFGPGGDDAIALAETNRALPKALLFGGAGNDAPESPTNRG